MIFDDYGYASDVIAIETEAFIEDMNDQIAEFIADNPNWQDKVDIYVGGFDSDWQNVIESVMTDIENEVDFLISDYEDREYYDIDSINLPLGGITEIDGFYYDSVHSEAKPYFDEMDWDGNSIIDEDEDYGDGSDFFDWSIDQGFVIADYDPYDDVDWQSFYRYDEELYEYGDAFYVETESNIYRLNLDSYRDLAYETIFDWELDFIYGWAPSDVNFEFDVAADINLELDNIRTEFADYDYIFDYQYDLDLSDINQTITTINDIEDYNYVEIIASDSTHDISNNQNNVVILSAANIELNTGSRIDVINSSNGSNIINSGAGDDLLIASFGDSLIGGIGDDSYIFSSIIVGENIIEDDDGNIIIDNQILAGIANQITGSEVAEDGKTNFRLGNYILSFNEENNDLTILSSLASKIVIKNFDSGKFNIDLNYNPAINLEEINILEDQLTEIDLLSSIENIETDQNLELIVAKAENEDALITIDQETQKIHYQSESNFFGTDTIKYLVSDGIGGFLEKSLILSVANVNDNPVAIVTSSSTSEDNAVIIDVLSGSSDIDGDNLVINSVTNGNNGLTQIVNGKISYVPDSNYHGTDSFEYTISDGNGGLVTKAVTVTISSVNDAPSVSISDQIQDSQILQSNNFNISFDQNSFVDIDGDALTYTAKLVDGSDLPDWMNFDASSRTFSGNVPSDLGLNANNNQLEIEVTANDGEFSVSQNFIIDIIGNTITGTDNGDSPEHLIGTDNNDIIVSEGVDTLTGGAGADTFVINKSESESGQSVTTITDFDPTDPGEVIDISTFGNITDFDDLEITDGSAIIGLGGNQIVRIKNITPEDLKANDFVFAENEAPEIIDNNDLNNNNTKYNLYIYYIYLTLHTLLIISGFKSFFINSQIFSSKSFNVS